MIQGIIIGVFKAVVTEKLVKEIFQSVIADLISPTMVKKAIIFVVQELSEMTDNDVDDKVVAGLKKAFKLEN